MEEAASSLCTSFPSTMPPSTLPGYESHPLVLHYHPIKHWPKNDEEKERGTSLPSVCETLIYPEVRALQMYCRLASMQDVITAPCSFPSTRAFGPLPVVIRNHSVLRGPEIVRVLREIRNIDTQNIGFDDSEEVKEEVVTVDTETHGSMTIRVVGLALAYLLWVDPECYGNFTLPLLYSNMPLGTFFARWCYILGQRRRALRMLNGQSPQELAEDCKKWSETIMSRLGGRRFFFSEKAPYCLDVVVAAWASALIAIPRDYLRTLQIEDYVIDALSSFVQRVVECTI